MVTNAGLIAAIVDPDLGGELISFSRVSETVNDKGRARHSEVFDTALANVQPAPGKEREMLPEGDRDKAAIQIFCEKELVAGAAGRSADRVFYRNGVYRVALAEPWLEHGGFTKAVAVLEKYVQQ